MSNTDNTELLALDVIESSGVAPDTVAMLKKNFLPFLEQARTWRELAEGLVVTDESQTREMRMAREARLALRQIRIDADKTRKELKADAIAYGRAVQAVYNTIEAAIKPTEEHLLEQEKFAEIQERKRMEALNAERIKIVTPLEEWLTVDLPFTWASFSEEEFQEIIAEAKAAKEAHEAEQARLEAERIAAEKARKEEEARIRAENAKLKKEAEERERKVKAERKKLEAKARKDREAADAKLAKERAERERLEAEARKRKEEEEARLQAEKEAAHKNEMARLKAEQAPDKEKLLAFAAELSALDFPSVSSANAWELANEYSDRLSRLAASLRAEAEQL